MDVIVNAYKNKSALFVFSVIMILLSLVTMIWFQQLTLSSFAEVFDKFQTMPNALVATFILNFFSGAGLLAAGALWIIAVFQNNDNYYSYSYYDNNSSIYKMIYALTGIAFICYSMVFFHYLFSKVGPFVFLVIVVGFIAYGAGNKK